MRQNKKISKHFISGIHRLGNVLGALVHNAETVYHRYGVLLKKFYFGETFSLDGHF